MVEFQRNRVSSLILNRPLGRLEHDDFDVLADGSWSAAS
jgi:hypothetical protein